MTKPSITYNHGLLDDCHKLTGLPYGDWTETEEGNIGAATVLYDDEFDINITSSTGNKIYYLSYPNEGGANNLSLNSTVYTKIFWRYICGDANIKAKIALVFSDATTQTVLAETNSQTWIAGSTTITTGKTIDHIRLYANRTTGHVYYDFILICKGIFTFPNTQYGKEYVPAPRNIAIEIPSRVTDCNQNLGSKSAKWYCSCNLDIGKWKRTDDTVNGQVFDDISHNSYREAFQWFNTGMGRQFKVVLDGEPRFREEDKQHILDLTFREYSRKNKNIELYVERFGLNL